MLLESVFGGVLFTQCGDIPLLMTGSKIFEIMQESESDSQLETVFGGFVFIFQHLQFLGILSSVLEKESMDLKVLV